MKRLSSVLAILLCSSAALAQWQVPENAVPFGRGAGTGFNSAAAAANAILATNGSNVPGLVQTLPNAVQDNITRLGTITAGAIPASLVTNGEALTKTDDTNVTLTFGGTPASAVLAATSITVGWSGQLALTRGGTGASLTASNGGIIYSTGAAMAVLSGTATAGQILRSGASAAPSWSTATYPTTAAQGTVLTATSANTIAASATPILGVPGTTLGTLGYAGNTSGTVTTRAAAAAGTWTFTWPTSGGTNGYALATDGSGTGRWMSVREVLTANRTYYIRADGNDNCTGLTDAAGASGACAFRNIQKFYDTVADYHVPSSITVTGQVRDGTFADDTEVNKCWTGNGIVFLVGNVATPANVQINGAGNMLSVTVPCTIHLGGGYAFTSSAGNLIYAEGAGAKIKISGPIQYHTTPNVQLYASRGGRIEVSANGSISGGADNFVQSSHAGTIRFDTASVQTFIANVTYTGAVAYANYGDLVFTASATMSAGGFTVTGKQWIAYGGMIQANAQSPPLPGFFPGTLKGSNNVPDFGGNIIRPAQLTAARTDNWDPPSLSQARYIFFTTDASTRELTGIRATDRFTNGQELTLVNIGSTSLILKHLSGFSSAGNQFALGGAVDQTIVTFSSYSFVYDGVNALWRAKPL